MCRACPQTRQSSALPVGALDKAALPLPRNRPVARGKSAAGSSAATFFPQMATCVIFFSYCHHLARLGAAPLIHAPRDLLSARCWSLLALMPMGQRDSGLNTPTDAGCVVHWKPEIPSFCLRQGYAFATNTLPGGRSIFFPVGSIRSVFPASRPPEFAAGAGKCTDTVPDGGVHHAPYGRQQQSFCEFAKVQE